MAIALNNGSGKRINKYDKKPERSEITVSNMNRSERKAFIKILEKKNTKESLAAIELLKNINDKSNI